MIGLNAALYWENTDPKSVISLVPTSAITGEGIADLLTCLIEINQGRMRKQIEVHAEDEFLCSVLEVKMLEGQGTTIDVILVNGELAVGDTIIMSGFNGPIVTTIRALLTPQPLREMRIKSEYIHHRTVQGAMGIKIAATNLDYALSGSPLYVAKSKTEEEILEYSNMLDEELANMISKYLNKKGQGLCVQSSTLGSLEALLEFLKTSNIPVAGIGIGPVYKKDIQKALKASAGTGKDAKEEFATLLAFDVKIAPEAQEFANENSIKIFTAKIIYHLFDAWTEHLEGCM
jgi:translation initiation factor 5B